MQISRISASNIRVNNNISNFSHKKENNTVNYEQSNKVLYNTIPFIVPFKANELTDTQKTESPKPEEIQSIKETLDMKYPNLPIATQLIKYNRDLISQREIALDALYKAKSRMHNRISEAGDIILRILEENKLEPTKAQLNASIGETIQQKNIKHEKMNTYTLKSKDYPEAELTIISPHESLTCLPKSEPAPFYIKEFSHNGLILARKEEQYYTGYSVKCNKVLGETGHGFIYPYFDDIFNKLKYDNGYMATETSFGVYHGDKGQLDNITTEVSYYKGTKNRLKIEQRSKKNGIEEYFYSLNTLLGLTDKYYQIEDIIYDTHNPADDIGEYKVHNETYINP